MDVGPVTQEEISRAKEAALRALVKPLSSESGDTSERASPREPAADRL